MIQIDPKDRLGNDLNSLQLLKKHDFFKGVDFEQLQKKNYTGNKQIIEERLNEL